MVDADIDSKVEACLIVSLSTFIDVVVETVIVCRHKESTCQTSNYNYDYHKIGETYEEEHDREGEKNVPSHRSYKDDESIRPLTDICVV